MTMLHAVLARLPHHPSPTKPRLGYGRRLAGARVPPVFILWAKSPTCTLGVLGAWGAFAAHTDGRSSLLVLDLPALYTRPGAETLLQVLDRLKLRPFDFSGPGSADEDDDLFEVQGGLSHWLTGIIKSRLAWVNDEEKREQIWDAASSRLAERAGQMGQTSSYRTFRIPYQSGDDGTADAAEITLYEPAVVGDNLGTKTWGSAYLLAIHLSDLASHVPALAAGSVHGALNGEPSSRVRILELGAGTGLVGMAARALFHADTTLTDLAGPVLDNLSKNIDSNQSHPSLRPPVGTLRCQALDWTEAPAADELPESDRFSVVIAADPVYDMEHPVALAKAVSAYLSTSAEARFIVEIPKREGFQDVRAALYKALDDQDLVAVARGVHLGLDEWGKDRSVQREHEWAVFQRD